MAKKPNAAGPGRPPSNNPKSVLISFRIDQRASSALEKMRDKIGVVSFSASDTAREVLLRAMKNEGFLK